MSLCVFAEKSNSSRSKPAQKEQKLTIFCLHLISFYTYFLYNTILLYLWKWWRKFSESKVGTIHWSLWNSKDRWDADRLNNKSRLFQWAVWHHSTILWFISISVFMLSRRALSPEKKESECQSHLSWLKIRLKYVEEKKMHIIILNSLLMMQRLLKINNSIFVILVVLALCTNEDIEIVKN